MLTYLRCQFPQAVGALSHIRGGRTPASECLQSFNAPRYAATRNFLNGTVSHLSPYIRHEVLTLSEVLAHLRQRFSGHDLYKFTQELAWRDYWQRIWTSIGDGIWQDREPSKTSANYLAQLPVDLGRTQLACMDNFAAELETWQ